MNRSLRWIAIALMAVVAAGTATGQPATTTTAAGEFEIEQLGAFPPPGSGTGIGLAVRATGKPFIAYTVGGDLITKDCADSKCEVTVSHTFDYAPLEVDFRHPNNHYLSLDDNSVATMIAILRDTVPATPDRFAVIRCNADPCTSTTIEPVGPGVVGFPSHSFVMVGPDRTLPLIFARNSGQLTRMYCQNVTCSSATVTNLGPMDVSGDVTAEFIPADGKARVAYTGPDYDLIFAECSDVPCSSLINSVTLREGDPPTTFAGYAPVMFNRNSKWVVGFDVKNQIAQSDLHVTFSTTPDFSGPRTEENLFGPDDRNVNPQIAAGEDGTAWIQVQGGPSTSLGPGLHLTKCAAISCAGAETVTVNSQFVYSHALTIASGQVFSAFGQDNKLWLATAPAATIFPAFVDARFCVANPDDTPAVGTRVTVSVLEEGFVTDLLIPGSGCAETTIPEELFPRYAALDVSPLSAAHLPIFNAPLEFLLPPLGETFEVKIKHTEARPQPPEVKVTRAGVVGGVPALPNEWPIELSVEVGCEGGTGFFLIAPNGAIVPLVEGPPGTYNGTAPPPGSTEIGSVAFDIDIDCPNQGSYDADLAAFVDPTAHVRTLGGAPLPNAEVRLFRSLDAAGPFVPVAIGSTIMGPGNRNIADSTDLSGRFGWSTVAGFYKVRAELSGCHAPGSPGVLFAETPVLTTPPAPLNVDLTLECPPGTSPLDTNCDDAFTAADPLASLTGLTGIAVDPGCPRDADGNGVYELADVVLQLRVLAGRSPLGPQLAN